MVNQSVSAQLHTAQSKISTICFANQILATRIINYIDKNRAAPSQTWVMASHATPFANSFRPCINVATEISSTCFTIKPGNCSTAQPKHGCDFISQSLLKFSTPEASCTLADLPNIVVRAADADILAGNGGVAWDFGTGLAADTAAQRRVVVQGGFNYDHSAGNPAPETATLVNTPNGIFNIRDDTTGLGGVGGISYTYVDENHNFIAGPDGTADAPTALGYGAQTSATRVQRANFVRMADLPGIKAINEAKFIIESTEIDCYTRNKVLNHYKTRLQKHGDKSVYEKLIGHGTPEEFATRTVSRASTQAGFGEEFSSSCYVQKREKFTLDSPQTPMAVQPKRDLWIPLCFYHTGERHNAFTAALTSDARLCYEFNIAPLSELFYPAAGNTFIREYVEFHNEANDDAGLINSPSRILERFIPVIIPNSNVEFAQDCCDINGELLQYHLYVDDSIHWILISRIAFELIRYFRDSIHCVSCECDKSDIELKNSAFPMEYMMVRDVPKINTHEGTLATAHNWHKLGHIQPVPIHEYTRHTFRDRATGDYSIHTRMSKHSFISKEHSIIKKMGVKIHDCDYYRDQDREFYSQWAYLVFHNGIWNIGEGQLSPLFVSFSQKPGVNQIYGLASNSRSRKITLCLQLECPDFDYTLPDGYYRSVPTNIPVSKIDIVVTACVINFLLSSDGLTTPRYV